MNKKVKSTILLLITALIFGSAFVAQRSGMDFIGPFTFNGIRCYMGGIVLLPLVFLSAQRTKRHAELEENSAEPAPFFSKDLLVGGVLCGLLLAAASSFQQYGLMYTTAGKGGFVTALYIVIVPVLALFLHRRVKPIIWLCIPLALVGLWLLTIKDGFSINRGDLLVFVCAFIFAGHILAIDQFAPKVDGIALSCIQFFVTGIVSTPFMLIFEEIDMANLIDCWLPLFYAGVLSCGVAFTLQIIAQKDADPAVASLLLSLESVFAVITGMIVLHETISTRELIGCIIMFVAIILAQLPEKKEVLK